MKLPELIKGGSYKDERGGLKFNNDFNALPVKRLYTIENVDSKFIRAWQGHKIENRWFSVMDGVFEIRLVKIDDWDSPSKRLPQSVFRLSSERLDVLAVPAGYVSSLQALEKDSKLLVMADYTLGEIQDEYRYDKNYFDENS